MVACLRDTPMFQLMNTHPNFYKWKHLQQTQEPVTAWSPRVDPEAGMSFMPNEPIDLMTSGNFQHVPWITMDNYHRSNLGKHSGPGWQNFTNQ